MFCKSRLTAPVALAAVLVWAAHAVAQGHPRELFVEVAQNRPEFLIRAKVDRADRIYREGETIQITVTSERAGYLYLFNVNSAKTITCLFPNEAQRDNRIEAHKPVLVPPDDAFKIRVRGPFGPEFVKAIVTTEKLDSLDVQRLIKTPTRLDTSGIKSLAVELKDRDNRNREAPVELRRWSWAEHAVEIVTVPTERERTTRSVQGRRVGICIGISTYANDIPRLGVCREDARRMAEVLRKRCDLEEVIVLTNEEATYRRIEWTIRREVLDKTRPGDMVVLFWSGHGGRILDGGEVKHDYLVPHDGRNVRVRDAEQSMILDDTFTRWLQDLDGRKVVVMLDACHAGGMKPVKGDEEPIQGAKPFFFRVEESLRRLKALDQADLAMLTSCDAKECSYIRNENDHSVMSYYLIDCLSAGKEPLTLAQLHREIEPKVSRYVRDFCNGRQTLVLSGGGAADIKIRP